MSDQTHKVTVVDGKHIKGIDFKVKSAPKFTGLVVFPDGKRAKGLDVLVEIQWSAFIFRLVIGCFGRYPIFAAAMVDFFMSGKSLEDLLDTML